MTSRRFLAVSLLTALLATPVWPQGPGDDIRLPALGDGASSLFSIEQEHLLGRTWLKVFRSQVRTVNDPLMQEYLENLTYRLATHSKLQDRRLEIVIVDNAALNAFAVPGGIVGVHNGMFLHADTEAQLASVLSHELAHISQRHFARGVEQQQRATLPTLAGMLGALVIAATAGGDAGMAAMTATQAAALQNRLNYSRQNEQEADRLGMETLVAAGYDPNAVAAMFDKMRQAMRYAGQRPPEFLLTHPLTENRISDARNRAREYPRKVYVDNLDYQLMRARAELQLTTNLQQTIRRFEGRLAEPARATVADRYGLALAYLKNGEFDKAREHLQPLLAQDPRRLPYLAADIEIAIGAGDLKTALARAEQELRIAPGNHPLTMLYADALIKARQYQRAEAVLAEHSKRRPSDPAVWYLLAEVHGLAGNIVGVHQARAEFFVLTGVLDRAQQQLSYALPLVRGDKLATARIEERIKQIADLKKTIEQL
ncbi:MAG: M48 family metalloprotease [Spongiibacteraceae bacterium]|nr:M48 family metalloprotease [Spongiibacteraceae bacterium]